MSDLGIVTSTSANTQRCFHTVKNHRSAFAVYSPLPLTTATYRSLPVCKRRLVPDDITYRNTLHTHYCPQETYSIYYWCTIASTHPFPQWYIQNHAQGHPAIDKMPLTDVCTNIPKSVIQIINFIIQYCVTASQFIQRLYRINTTPFTIGMC